MVVFPIKGLNRRLTLIIMDFTDKNLWNQKKSASICGSDPLQFSQDKNNIIQACFSVAVCV